MGSANNRLQRAAAEPERSQENELEANAMKRARIHHIITILGCTPLL